MDYIVTVDAALIAARIEDLGRRLVACRAACAGIVCQQERGIIPRCLIYEGRKPGGRGAVVIGLNPGKSAEREQRHYRDAGSSYESVLAWWSHAGSQHKYYKRLRRFLDAIGFDGPILWTELVKCESERGLRLPVQTLRMCTGEYLQSEVDAVPDDWTLFAIGRVAFTATAYRFPRRTVLGVPHPTGSYGHFDRMLAMTMIVHLCVEQAGASRTAEWLPDGLATASDTRQSDDSSA